MPELGEQLYSAIRTQPNDLLKWATTYFRCLSLNIPPPVKPRLEYPISKDHHGMTPGWLRALLYQMAGTTTHPNLIQILVLGGFEDNMAVPWLRFIGLCAAHLTENLTQTMILICEILTEEPEGRFAMICVEIFVDLYQFLARIDASIPQTLRNYYFLDKILELYQEKIAKDSGTKAPEEDQEEERSSAISTESTLKSEGDGKKVDETSVVSCPSVTSQDPDNYMKLLMKTRQDGEESIMKMNLKSESNNLVLRTKTNRSDLQKFQSLQQRNTMRKWIKRNQINKTQKSRSLRLTFSLLTDVLLCRHNVKKDFFPSDKQDNVSRDTRVSSARDKSVCDDTQPEKLEENEYFLEDLEILRAVQQELMGEDDEELEKFKASMLADAGLTPSQIVAPEHFETKLPEEEIISHLKLGQQSLVRRCRVKRQTKLSHQTEYEDVFVDAVPGIGPKVPEIMIAAVINFMKETAKVQHGMVMPRNIRHFECPPLEVSRL
ncbi:hypothetical protein Zmor_018158 [Zophobas morio]|uniref:Uncharacterized protein n=1 Tax=Zophobas morio TaxID=2755281 RepID=A0AA38I9F5_9CUCU|nr:hypothetical protein Zmor_018158 [Zophobas morio]